MRAAVLWDSSAILAAIDARDENHQRAAAAVDELAAAQLRGFMTNYIEAETHALLLRKLGRGAALQWLQKPGIHMVRAGANEEDAARAMLMRFADKDWSLCDAISFAVMEARGVREAFAYDAHFRQWGKCRVRG